MSTALVESRGSVDAFSKALEVKRPSLLKLAPAGFDASALVDRVKAQASMVLLKKPDLADCDLATFVMAVTNVVELGLDLSGPLPTAYIVAFKENGQKKAQAMIAYTGLRELAVRSGCVKTIQAEVVHEKDEFDWQHTDAGLRFTHKHGWSDRGKVVGFYAHAITPDGVALGCRMSLAQVETIRDNSPAFKFAPFSPWKAGPQAFIEMGKKTAIRRMAKSLTLSPILNRAMEILDGTEGGLPDEPSTPPQSRREALQRKLVPNEAKPPAEGAADEPAAVTAAPSEVPFDPAKIAADMDNMKPPKRPAFDLDGNPVS